MTKRIFCNAAALIGILAILCGSAWPNSLTVVAANHNLMPGGSTDVVLVISGLADKAAPSLGVFDLNLSFDPSILGFTGAAYGDPMLGDQLDLFGLGSLSATDDSTPGLVNVFELSFDLPDDLNTLQADTFTLATLHFAALAGGTSSLDVTVNSLGDADGNPLDATITNDAVAVEKPTAVPEPGSILLVAAGVPAFLLLRNRPLRQPCYSRSK